MRTKKKMFRKKNKFCLRINKGKGFVDILDNSRYFVPFCGIRRKNHQIIFNEAKKCFFSGF